VREEISDLQVLSTPGLLVSSHREVRHPGFAQCREFLDAEQSAKISSLKFASAAIRSIIAPPAFDAASTVRGSRSDPVVPTQSSWRLDDLRSACFRILGYWLAVIEIMSDDRIDIREFARYEKFWTIV